MSAFATILAPLLKSPRVIVFGMLCGVVSAFGQTFFIALFVPDFSQALDVSEAQFGAIYGGVTVASALLLPYVGAKLDHVSVTRFATLVFLAVAFSCALIALSPIPMLLVVGLFGVRFAGQGLCGHTWSTSIARYFTHSRGTALALASQGHPIGEGIWPAVFIALIAAIGWRGAFGTAGALVVFLFIPLVWALLSRVDTRPQSFHASEREDPPPSDVDKRPSNDLKRQWTRSEVLRDKRVWLLLPAWFAAPFALTGLFFHQIALTQARGFSTEGVALAFVGYATARGGGAFVAGALVDKYGGARVVPYILFPMAAGFFCAGAFSNDVAVGIYFVLAGSTLGLAGSARGAFLAEIFGTQNLGAIRSTLVAIAVWSTAIAPPLYGYAASAGISWQAILYASGIALVVASMGAFVAIRALALSPVPRDRIGESNTRDRNGESSD